MSTAFRVRHHGPSTISPWPSLVVVPVLVLRPRRRGGPGRRDRVAQRLHLALDRTGGNRSVRGHGHGAGGNRYADHGDARQPADGVLDLGRAGGTIHAADAVFQGLSASVIACSSVHVVPMM